MKPCIQPIRAYEDRLIAAAPRRPASGHATTRLGVAAIALALAPSACGGEAAEWDDAAELVRASAALTPPQGWRPWGELPSNPGTTATFAGDPAVCLASLQGVVVLGRDRTTNVYRSLAFRITRYSDDPVWQDIGTRTFASKPACTALDETRFSQPSERSNQIIVLGRNASDNRFYAVPMQADEFQDVDDPCCNPEPPDQPIPLDIWRQIGTAAYASAPAATVAFGKLLVVGRRSDNRLYLHRNTLSAGDNPYSSQNWVPAISVPSLPSGVGAVGDPTIANGTEINGEVWIMTRVTRSNGSNAFYYIFWNNQRFSTWREFSNPSTYIYSDPALEIGSAPGNEWALTLYYRGSRNDPALTHWSMIHQTSTFDGTTFEPVAPVRPTEGDTFLSAPAAVGGATFEGQHYVVAKKSNDRFYASAPVPF